MIGSAIKCDHCGKTELTSFGNPPAVVPEGWCELLTPTPMRSLARHDFCCSACLVAFASRELPVPDAETQSQLREY